MYMTRSIFPYCFQTECRREGSGVNEAFLTLKCLHWQWNRPALSQFRADPDVRRLSDVVSHLLESLHKQILQNNYSQDHASVHVSDCIISFISVLSYWSDCGVGVA